MLNSEYKYLIQLGAMKLFERLRLGGIQKKTRLMGTRKVQIKREITLMHV